MLRSLPAQQLKAESVDRHEEQGGETQGSPSALRIPVVMHASRPPTCIRQSRAPLSNLGGGALCEIHDSLTLVPVLFAPSLKGLSAAVKNLSGCVTNSLRIN